MQARSRNQKTPGQTSTVCPVLIAGTLIVAPILRINRLSVRFQSYRPHKIVVLPAPVKYMIQKTYTPDAPYRNDSIILTNHSLRARKFSRPGAPPNQPQTPNPSGDSPRLSGPPRPLLPYGIIAHQYDSESYTSHKIVALPPAVTNMIQMTYMPNTQYSADSIILSRCCPRFPKNRSVGSLPLPADPSMSASIPPPRGNPFRSRVAQPNPLRFSAPASSPASRPAETPPLRS